MKNKQFVPMLFFAATLCIASSCKKHDPGPTDPLASLPPATQTGANTFGCLVNGQAFVPHANFFTYTSAYQCNYIYTNGGYYLTVAASNDSNSNYIVNINFGTDSLSIYQGEALKLESNSPGKANAEYDLISGSVTFYKTTKSLNGQLFISKFDQNNQIVSGTFFFDAVNTANDTVHITDGRFDMKYTQ